MTESSEAKTNLWVFGNPDSTKFGFETEASLVKYLRGEVFSKENGRYRHTLKRNDVAVVVLSRKGLAYGHLNIKRSEAPTDADMEAFPKVERVYLVGTAVLYEFPVTLSSLSIKGLQFGYPLSLSEFESILVSAGSLTSFSSGVTLPVNEIELGRVLREVQQRLYQSKFRSALLNAYGSKCAISGCQVSEVLEAAHIDPWCNSGSNDISNGLLLRADIHTLFDRNFIGIDPETVSVVLRESIRNTEYGQFHGARLSLPTQDVARPSLQLLKSRWEDFRARMMSDSDTYS